MSEDKVCDNIVEVLLAFEEGICSVKIRLCAGAWCNKTGQKFNIKGIIGSAVDDDSCFSVIKEYIASAGKLPRPEWIWCGRQACLAEEF